MSWSPRNGMQNVTYTSQGFRSTMVDQPMIDYHLDVLENIQKYLKSSSSKKNYSYR